MYSKIYYIIIIFNAMNYNTLNIDIIIKIIKMIKTTVTIVVIKVKCKTII